MMIKIEQIDDIDLGNLIDLYHVYNQRLVTKHNMYHSTKILVDKLATPHALALGLYRDSKLVGFIIGHGISGSVFYFTDMYIMPKYRYYTKDMLIDTETFIKRLGYTSWVSESSTKEGMRMFEHYGAQTIEIKYYKEL